MLFETQTCPKEKGRNLGWKSQLGNEVLGI